MSENKPVPTHKDVKEMTTEELRREVYRLRHIRTDLTRKLQAVEAVRDHLQTNDARRITDAIERMLTGWRYRG